ncbi:MAG: hypothetical protein K8S99_17995 [Planctomycetes bacterium]|nr:hypothetical protein [Planctomycetota bacterium]
MSTTPLQPAFPSLRVCAALSAASLATAVVMAAVVLIVPGWSACLGAVALAACVVWIASLVGLVPVAVMGPFGVSSTLIGYFSGMGARVLLCIIGGLAGVYVMGLATQPLLLGMAAMYMPLLLVEAGYVGRYLSAKDPVTPTEKTPGGDHKEALA